ncbi:uncharacterized protein [Littorina saxatilis]|uniref:uncharacterized protein isoform X2 n=1 Tax=Littorina saxatilis TaxID=31220 RepID=UPI0038B680BF
MLFSAMYLQKGWTPAPFVCVLLIGIQNAVSAEECNTTHKARSGSLQSPNYPSSYANNEECSYLISVLPGYRITLTFLNFTLEPPTSASVCLDYVEVFDGSTTTSPRFGRYCGSENPGSKRTTQNEMLVRFYSDKQSTFSGFNASYKSDELGDQIIVEGAQGFLRRLDWETVSYTGYVKENVYGLSNVEFDVFDFRIFWTERTHSRIHSILLNGSDNRIVVDLGQDAVLSDIAFDSPSGLLFYLDSGNDVIGVVSSSGDAHKPVISTDLQDGSRISLDTKIGKVFWTSGRTLQSAHYDGSNVKTLLSSADQSTILSVAVDSRTGDIYFLEVEDEVAAIQSLQSEWRTTRVIFDEYDDLIYHINVNTTSTKPMSRLERSSRNRYVGEQFHTIGYIVEDVAFYRQTAAHQKQTECRRNKLGACGPGQICIPLPSGSVKCISTDPGANSAADDDDDNRLAIIGGALGGFAFIVTVVLVVVLVVFLIRSKRAKRQRNDTSCGTATMAYSSRPRADDEHFYDSPHHNDGYIHPISVVPEHSRR